MVKTAAHLVDHVFPPLPVRQWVLAVPKRLRYFLRDDADLQGAVLRIFLAEVERCLRYHSAGCGDAARSGAVVFIHRFGSSLNEHVHFHCCVIDGVFEPAEAGDTDAAPGVVFHAAVGLDNEAIAAVQAQVRRRVLRTFVRRGLIEKCDAEEMAAGNTVAGSRWMPRCASPAPTGRDWNGCCVTARAHPSRWNTCSNGMPNIWSIVTTACWRPTHRYGRR